ncbi:MAG: ATP-binding cassette domain-containing protein [Bacilli bacterium]|nr:ATP-binding cassette domain-containing protein [Bacilli bacterium]
MFSIVDLNYTYPGKGESVLNHVNMDLPDTGLFYLVGESGSGKSTFIHLLSGLVNKYEGNIFYNGRDLCSMSKKQRGEYLRTTCSVAFQQDEFDRERTVEANLMDSLEIYEISESEKHNRIKNIAKKLCIYSFLNQKVKYLSGGEIKRVSLARALIKNFAVLLLDEPFGPLDCDNRRRLNKIFLMLSHTCLIIIVSHNQKEIPSVASILKITDGMISFTRKKKVETGQYSKKTPFPKRCHPSLISSATNGFRMLSKQKRQSNISIFSLSFALVTIGLIILIFFSISSSLKTYFTGVIDENSVLVQPRKEQIVNENYSATSYIKLQQIEKDNADSIYGVGAHYQINFENLFINQNEVYFNWKSKKFTLSDLSARSFEEFTYCKEIKNIFPELNNVKKLSDDEIILGLPYEDISYICKRLNFFGPDKLSKLNEFFNVQKICLHLDIECAQIGYKLESLFSVSRILETDVARIIHTDPLFSEYFVEENMRFQGNGKLEDEYNKPWVVHKVYFLYCKKERKQSILNEIELRKEYENIYYKSLSREYMLLDGKMEISKNRLALYDDYQKSLSLADIYDIYVSQSNQINSVLISDGFYYYSNEGMTSGFLHPLFVSNKREKLNQIEDYNYAANFDLHGFQGSSIIFDEGVIMGDLSNTQTNPLSFHPCIHFPELVKGYEPLDFNQVIISSNLAQSLFHTLNIISSPLYISCLTSTEYISGGYKNIFCDGQLLITGIIESDKNEIYQKPRFLRNLGENQLDIEMKDRKIDKVIIRYNSHVNVEKAMAKARKEYPDYSFSLPAKAIAGEIDIIINYIDAGLSLFGILSSIISCVLMIEVISLFIKQDRKRTKMFICLGWLAKDLRRRYILASVILGTIAYINSFLTIKICEMLLEGTIGSELGINIHFSNWQIGIVNMIFVIITILISCMISERRINDNEIF